MKIAQSIFFVLAYFVSFGQSGTISGKILTSEGNDIKSILQITINPSNQKVNTTNYGEFSFDKLAPGTYEISLTGEGYINKKTNVTITNDEKRSIIILAQEKVLDIPEIIFSYISITGGEKGIKELPGSAYFLSEKELKKHEYTDVNRVLKNIPGVNIQEEDGFGLRPNIGLRGSGVDRSTKITIMEDGILMAPAPYAASAAYYFPTIGRMQGVEILKGSSQIKYGPYTTGGAINFISTQLPNKFDARISAIGGSFFGRNLHAFIGNAHERIAYSLESFSYGSNGFKRLDNGGNTGFTKTDYVAKVSLSTKKSAKTPQTLTFKFGRNDENSNETYLGLSLADFKLDPFKRYAASAKDNIKATQIQLSAMHHIQIKPWMGITTSIYKNTFTRNWYKLDAVKDSLGTKKGIADILKNPTQFAEHYSILKGQTSLNSDALYMKGNNRSYFGRGVQTQINFDIKKFKIKHKIDLGIRLHQDGMDRFQNEDQYKMNNGTMFQTSEGELGRESNKLTSATALASFIQYQLSIGKLLATGGIRYETIFLEEQDFGKLDPQRTGINLITNQNKIWVLIPGIGLDYKLSQFMAIFGGVHKGFAPPSSKDGSKPESSINYETGVKIYKNAFSAQTVIYYNAYQNLLGSDLAASGGPGNGELYNGGKSKAQGLEMLVAYDFGKFISKKVRLPLTIGYTYTDARFLSSFISTYEDWGTVNKGDQLPYLAMNQLTGGLCFEYGKISINLNAKYTSEMRAIAGQEETTEENKIPASLILDFSTKYQVTKNISFFSSITNLLNQVYIVSVRPAGFRPGMPFSFQLGLSGNLN